MNPKTKARFSRLLRPLA